jgi:hypothetical protein
LQLTVIDILSVLEGEFVRQNLERAAAVAEVGPYQDCATFGSLTVTLNVRLFL